MCIETNIASALAHSMVFFSKLACGEPAGKTYYLNGGDPPAPTTQETTAQMMQAIQDYLPGVMGTVNTQILPNELAQLQASQAVSPGYAALQAQLYGTTGRDLNRIGNEIAQENALASASRDAAVMAGPGMDLIRQANAAQREIDPEYYATRAATSAGLADMFKPMSGGEEEAINRYLNRQNFGRGTLNVPSMSQVVQNAQTFGNASRDRLGQAIQMATSAMPQFRSGVDVFQQATGKPSFANTGEQRFMGARQEAGQQSTGFANNFMGQIGENQRTAMNINANRRDTFDRVAPFIPKMQFGKMF